MEKKSALEALIDLTNKRFGRPLSSPAEFNELSVRIKNETGYNISLSSIKRLWGYVNYSGSHSISTLNILAIYNGYEHWEGFLNKYNTEGVGDESTFLGGTVVNAAELNKGDKLVLSWEGGKSCVIECVDKAKFRVNESCNIKLQPGDVFVLSTVCKGLPFYASDIERGNLHIPAYVGAQKGGVRSIIVLR